MVGLVDLVNSEKLIHGMKVYGVDSGAIITLFKRFPALEKISTGVAIKASDIVSIAPEAIPAIIAAGCGYLNDKEQEDAAKKLGVERQLDFMEAIAERTFPSGPIPFKDRLQKLIDRASGELTKGAVMKSAPESKPSWPAAESVSKNA